MKTRDNKKLKIQDSLSTLFIGIPGPSLIGTLSLSYIVHSLKMEMIGEIEHLDVSNIIFVDNGNLSGPIRIYKNGNNFVLLSDIPIDHNLSFGFVDAIINFCNKNKIGMIVMLSGLHVPNRDPSNLKTYGLVTDEKLDRILYENEIPKFLSGMITGPDAIILTILRNSGIPTIVLYTECNFFFPDPEAAIYTIKTISRIMRVEIDITEFKKQIDFIRLQSRQLMEETLTVLHPEKAPPSVPAPSIYK